MGDSQLTRAWTSGRGLGAGCGGAAAANLRIAASSVGPISRTDIDPPRVLALLDSRPFHDLLGSRSLTIAARQGLRLRHPVNWESPIYAV